MLQFPHSAGAIFKVTDRLGIDLAEAIRSDTLRPEDLSGMMSACDSCWKTQRCARWVRDARGDCSGAMPDFCPSHELLNRLSAGTQALSDDQRKPGRLQG